MNYNILFIIILINILISLISVLQMMIEKSGYKKKYEVICKEFLCKTIQTEYKINSPEFVNVLKNNSYDVMNKQYSNLMYKRNRNRFMIYSIINESCKLFSNLYNDAIYCNLRINRENSFYTIAHFRYLDTISIKDRLYDVNKNTELTNLMINSSNRFIISNIDDFKQSYPFYLQDYELMHRSKAIISISLKNRHELVGVYTIYFSKPLDDKVKLLELEYAITFLKNKLTELTEEYIEINKDNHEIITNMIIQNKIH